MVKIINAKHQHAGIFSMSTENHYLVPGKRGIRLKIGNKMD